MEAKRPLVTAGMGDIFEGGRDLTVLPCGAKPTWTATVQRWISHYKLPTPLDLMPRMAAGDVTPTAAFPHVNGPTRWIAYGAAVFDDQSSPEIVRRIGENIGAITRANADIRQVESVLFGTGHGRLAEVPAAMALAAGFRSAATADACLRIFVHTFERQSRLSEVLESGGQDRQLPDEKLMRLRDAYTRLRSLSGQRRGYEFENFLKTMLDDSGLAARSGYRIAGEQVDGSFDLDGANYLLEARWQRGKTDGAALRAFEGRLHERAAWTRGLFVSHSGFTADALTAFGRGKRIICMDGEDLERTLDHGLTIEAILRRKVRQAAEEGSVFTPFDRLFPDLSAAHG